MALNQNFRIPERTAQMPALEAQPTPKVEVSPPKKASPAPKPQKVLIEIKDSGPTEVIEILSPEELKDILDKLINGHKPLPTLPSLPPTILPNNKLSAS